MEPSLAGTSVKWPQSVVQSPFKLLYFNLVRQRQKFGPECRRLKADLHGTILSHATSLRHAYDTKKGAGFENMF